jgi:hypothetical protein
MMLGLLVADLVDHLGLGAPDVVEARGARLSAPITRDYNGPLTPEQRERKNARRRAMTVARRAEREATR